MNIWLFMLGTLLVTAGGAAGAQRAEFVYAGTDAGSIYQFRIAANGALQPLTPPAVRVYKQSLMLVLHPSGRFAYAVTVHERDHGRDYGQVFCYRINTNGALVPLGPEPNLVATPVDNVTIDPKGRFLFVSGEGGRLFTFCIRHDGTLEPLEENKVVGTFHIDTQADGGGELTGIYAQDVMTFDPAGRFLYVFANTGFVDHREYKFVSYRLDARGTLSPLAPVVYGRGENAVPFSTLHGGLFVSRFFTDKEGTYRFYIGPSGLLAPMTPPMLTNQYALLTTAASDGETLWTERRADDQKYRITSYRIGSGGHLTIRAANAGVLPSLRQFSASRLGRFFYVADYRNDGYFTNTYSSLLGYAATPQGTLKAVGAPPRPLDGLCLSLVIRSSTR